MTSFHEGQVVVCIDDAGLPGPEALAGICPKEGGVYTVRAVRCEEGPGLLLAELINPEFEWIGGQQGELSFHVRRFRPAKTASLEVFEDRRDGESPVARTLRLQRKAFLSSCTDVGHVARGAGERDRHH